MLLGLLARWNGIMLPGSMPESPTALARQRIISCAKASMVRTKDPYAPLKYLNFCLANIAGILLLYLGNPGELAAPVSAARRSMTSARRQSDDHCTARSRSHRALAR